MPRDNRKQKNEPKNSAPPKSKGRVNTKAAQRRHERSIDRAIARRRANGWTGEQAQAKIDAKAATRRRMKSYTPAVRAEHSAAGREHRKPRRSRS